MRGEFMRRPPRIGARIGGPDEYEIPTGSIGLADGSGLPRLQTPALTLKCRRETGTEPVQQMSAKGRNSQVRSESAGRGMPAMRRSVLGGEVTQAIIQDLGVGIVTGRFGHITFPTESALCKTYGAARTVLREAVKVLAA